MQGPIGVAKQFSSEQYDLSLAALNDLLGLMGIGDHANGAGGDGALLPDALGERNLVAGADCNFSSVRKAARGDVDQIDTMGAQQGSEFDRFVDIPAAFDPIRGRNAHEEREFFRPNRAYGVHHVQHEAGAVLRSCRRSRLYADC